MILLGPSNLIDLTKIGFGYTVSALTDHEQCNYSFIDRRARREVVAKTMLRRLTAYNSWPIQNQISINLVLQKPFGTTTIASNHE